MKNNNSQKATPMSNDTTDYKDEDIIGIVATIRWRESGEVNEGFYISVEEFPEDAPEDDYILPKAQIRDDQVFQYYNIIELAETIANNDNPDYEILDFLVITEKC